MKSMRIGLNLGENLVVIAPFIHSLANAKQKALL